MIGARTNRERAQCTSACDHMQVLATTAAMANAPRRISRTVLRSPRGPLVPCRGKCTYFVCKIVPKVAFRIEVVLPSSSSSAITFQNPHYAHAKQPILVLFRPLRLQPPSRSPFRPHDTSRSFRVVARLSCARRANRHKTFLSQNRRRYGVYPRSLLIVPGSLRTASVTIHIGLWTYPYPEGCLPLHRLRPVEHRRRPCATTPQRPREPPTRTYL